MVVGQIPPITWLSLSARVGRGLSGVLRAETRDEASANGLRDMIRGLLAMATVQAPKGPGSQSFLSSLELGGTGSTVSLSFEAPVELLEMLSPPSAPAADPAGESPAR
jgi:hypothetical protein